ncbi:hypothetical protein NUACC21_31090 [Scytonema sp. NUACC21]
MSNMTKISLQKTEESKALTQIQREKFQRIIDNAEKIVQPSFPKNFDCKNNKSGFVTKEEFIRRLKLVSHKTIQV